VKVIHRYVLREFLYASVMSSLSFMAVFIIIDILEKIDTFIDHHAALTDILEYYAFSLPYVGNLVLPMGLLLGGLLSLGYLAKNREIDAMSCSGISLGQILKPVLLVGLGASILSFVAGEILIPPSNLRKDDVWAHRIKKRPQRKPTVRENIVYLGEAGKVYLIERYLIREKKMEGVVVQEFSRNTLARRIDAKTGVWNGSNWVLKDGFIRVFSPEGERVSYFPRMTLKGALEKPDDFAEEARKPAEMNFLELWHYISKVRQSGGRVTKHLVELNFKISFPFVNVIVLLVGTPLSTKIRRGTLTLGIAVSLLIAFTYYGFLRTGQALGHSGVLPPILAAWLGNLFFGAAGVLFLRRVQNRV